MIPITFEEYQNITFPNLELIQRMQQDETVLQYNIVSRITGAPVDITKWNIYIVIKNDRGSGASVDPILKATKDITDGADTQIKITDAANGVFTIYFSKVDTENMTGNAEIEIWRAKDSGDYLVEKIIATGHIEFIERLAEVRIIT